MCARSARYRFDRVRAGRGCSALHLQRLRCDEARDRQCHLGAKREKLTVAVDEAERLSCRRGGLAIDVRTLTEAGQSLGAGWAAILFRIILPNIRVAILSGAFISFAIVMGELIIAQYLVKPAFAPFMAYLMQQKAYEPAALAIVSFALTWASIGVIQLVGRGGEQAQIAAGH